MKRLRVMERTTVPVRLWQEIWVELHRLEVALLHPDVEVRAGIGLAALQQIEAALDQVVMLGMLDRDQWKQLH